MHNQGIENNDIKPGNILFSPERGAVLCDFGLSSRVGLSPSTAGGTPYYVPAEYIDKKSRGKPGDVWAFGVTMLYVLRHTKLPDARGRLDATNYLHWNITEVHSSRTDFRPTAKEKMIFWIKEIEQAKRKIKDEEDDVYILRDMLDFDPNRRVAAHELAKRLAHESQSKQQPRKFKPKALLDVPRVRAATPSDGCNDRSCSNFRGR